MMMDDSTIALVQEFVNNLRNIIEVFTNFSSASTNLDSLTPGLLNMEGLEKQMEKFKEELRKHDIKTNADVGDDDNGEISAAMKDAQRLRGDYATDVIVNLQSENKQLRDEVTHLRNELDTIMQKLSEETTARKHLQQKLEELTRNIEFNRTICKNNAATLQRQDSVVLLSDTQNNSRQCEQQKKLCWSPDMEDKCISDVSNNNTKEIAETQKITNTHATQDKTFFYEKTNSCQPRPLDCKKENEKLRSRNIELERQLNEERKKVSNHEKRLVVFSQATRNLQTPQTYNNNNNKNTRTSFSAPTSPCDNDNNNNEGSLFRKYYDNNAKRSHEMNVKRPHKHNNTKSNSFDSISTQCTDYTMLSYGSYVYDLDVVTRNGRTAR